MAGLSRRHILASLCGLIAGTVLLPACCFIRRILGKPCNTYEDWKRKALPRWKELAAARERKRAEERADGRRPDVPLPRPDLDCGRVASARGPLSDQVRNIPPNRDGEVGFTIRNRGNTPSWSCCAEIYEAPGDADDSPFTGMKLTGRTIVTVLPGETKEVVLPWKRTRGAGCAIARCYDPLFDTAAPKFRKDDRKTFGSCWS